MKDINRLVDILTACTVQLRKGAVVTKSTAGPIKVTEINAMPHVDDAAPGLEKIDMVLLVVGVHREEAMKYRDEVIAILNTYPVERLMQGPSYIEMGAEIGDQGLAFQLFALGEVLGLWEVLTPAKLFHAPGDVGRTLAQNGYVLISGYNNAARA